jgi:hypothetical protein
MRGGDCVLLRTTRSLHLTGLCGKGANMTDTPPDRLCIDPSSPHFDVEVLRRGVGIKFRGIQRHDVEEYCMSEGWVRVQAGKTVDRRGKPLLLKLNGPVEAWFENADAQSGAESTPEA